MGVVNNVKPGYGFISDKGKALLYSYTIMVDEGFIDVRFCHCDVRDDEIYPASNNKFNIKYPSVYFDIFKEKEKEEGVPYGEMIRAFSDIARDTV